MKVETPNFEANLGKSVDLPESNEIIERLRQVGLYGLTPQTDAFYQRFATSIGGSSKVGAGLNVAWELAGYDTLRGLPNIVRAAVNLNFDRAIDAITPDIEVAEQAKEFRRKALAEVEQNRKAAEPTLESLGQADRLDNLERYVQARNIGNIVFEQVTRKAGRSGDGIWMQDWREEEVNPFYRQTHRGFFLEQYYSMPNILWTPWGDYHIGGSGSGWSGESRQVVLDRLGVTLYKPEVNTEIGTIGPIYAVHKIDGVDLPQPIERPRSQYVSYEEAKNAWRSLTRQYKTGK